MNEHGTADDDRPQDPDSPLDRASAAAPIPWTDSSPDDGTAENAEPAITHDSEAGVEEQHATDPDAVGDELAGPDRLTSIYGPPPGEPPAAGA